jgi:hypothetical protein
MFYSFIALFQNETAQSRRGNVPIDRWCVGGFCKQIFPGTPLLITIPTGKSNLDVHLPEKVNNVLFNNSIRLVNRLFGGGFRRS